MIHLCARVVDAAVPFGILLRSSQDLRPFERWDEVLWRYLPHTFFVYWLFTFIPLVGGLLYMLVLVPISLKLKPPVSATDDVRNFAYDLLVYYTVILVGFGGIWSFVGHMFLSDRIASRIGWEVGSPFQIELAFYTLGTAVAALLAIWLRGHLITAIVVSKSIFWYGAAYVHIHDAVVSQNYAPLNVGAPLIGDVIYPTLLLGLLAKVHLRVSRRHAIISTKPSNAVTKDGPGPNADDIGKASQLGRTARIITGKKGSGCHHSGGDHGWEMLPMKVIAYWIVFAVTLAVYGTMLAWSLPTVAASAGGLTPFDMRPGGYSYAEAEAFLAALTTEGAAFYRDVQLRLDIVYPPLLAVTVGWAIWWLLPPGWGFWRAFAVLPAVGGMVFDWMENNAINGLLQVGAAGLTEQMVSSASLYSQAKAMASTVSFLLLLLAFAWWSVQRFRGRST